MLLEQGAYMRINQSRCLNQQHNSVECHHCISHCPGKALALHEGQVYRFTEKCLGCGLCLAECPTQVFTASQWDERMILNDVESQGAAVTQIFCGRHDTPFLGKEDKAKGAIQIPGCLSAISKGLWYELGLKTEVELRLEQCGRCPLNQCMEERGYLAIATAEEWLTASEHPMHFSYIEEAEKVKKKKKLKATSSGLKVTSRRDLFLALAGKKKAEGLPINNGGKRNPFLPGKFGHQAGKDFLPEWRKNLEQYYAPNFCTEERDSAYWPTLKLGDKCVNCGMCSAYCPTQALQIIIKNRRCTYSFNSGRCLDCRICMLVCPAQNISRSRTPMVRPFETKVMAQSPVVRCKYCNSYTIPNEQGKCYWCEQEVAATEVMNDFRKQFVW